MSDDVISRSRIGWTRYWCPRTGTYNLTDDGFLNKDFEYDIFSKDAKPLEDLADVPCLVLLGSPGMGKTDELTTAFSSDHGSQLFVDLGRLDAALPLRETLSEDPKVKQWTSSTEAPTLWLDSLDEGVGDVANLARLLGGELSKLKKALPHLRVRITCRIANWPASLEHKLKDLWQGDACQVYELLPLRVEDAELAAAHHQVNFDPFLEAVCNAKAGPLAAKPVTLLRMLLPEFKENGRLPGSQVDLYEQGCKRLAAEWATGRQEKAESSNNDAEARFKAAQFVAAGMTFYGRNVLDCNPERDTGSSGAVHSREIGSAAGMGTESFTVPSITNVEAVAKTALMSGASSHHHYRFEHRTFQEYLAASFLHSQVMPLPKTLTLFLNPSGSDKRVVPQLIETAAWLAALDSRFRDALLKADPVAVLHSDVAAQDDATQRKLFAALRAGLCQGEVSGSEWNARRDFRSLRFNGIADEILTILNDASEPEQVREFAIDVAWHARIHEVYDRLADLALDTTRPLREREHCTYALARQPEESEDAVKAKARLEPLLETTSAEDSNDNLHGNALYALWHTLDPVDLFASIRPPYNPNHVGAYWAALDAIRRGLEPRHMLAGLAWAEKQPNAHALDRDSRKLMSRVFNLAWRNLDHPGVLDALAKAAAARIQINEDVRLDDDGEEDYDRYNRRQSDMPSELASNDPQIVARRRRLCQAMVRQVRGSDSAAFWLVYYMCLENPDDFEWLLEQHVASTVDDERKVWLDMALHVWSGLADQVAVVQRLGARHESVHEAFRERIALLDPESPESKAAREKWEHHERELQETQTANTPEPLDPSLAQRIDELLNACDKGDLESWWRLWLLLRVDDYGQYMHGLYFEPDTRKMPYWQSATPGTRRRLTDTAEIYVNQGREDPDEFVGEHALHYPSAAGLSALMLLYHERQEVFESLPADAWARWPHIVLNFPNAEYDGIWAGLLVAGYKKAPVAFRNAVEGLLRSQKDDAHQAPVLWRLKPVWDEPLCGTVFGVVSAEPCSQAVLTQALDLLLEHGHKPARRWCMKRIDEAVETGQTTDARLESAVSALLLNRPKRDEWTRLWALLAHAPHKDFALGVFGQDRYGRRIGCDDLSESQLADFYIWLRCNAPAVPEHHGAYTPGPAESLDELKRTVLNVLIQRGNPAAVEQCERIHAEIGDDWFFRVIIAAKAEARRTGWVPVKPQDLWKYVAKSKSRLVRSEYELCDAIMEALEQVNAGLHGENPSVPDLWDDNEPKDERHLSNWLTRQLRSELKQADVFIGREIAVNLRRQTDIQVVATLDDEPEFGVIIEVKGCWHKEVKTAMQTQLRDDYLANHSFTHGIYVVGWFYCDAWKKKRHAYGKEFREQTADNVQEMFEKQAKSLSSGAMTIRTFVLDATLPN